MEFDLENPLTYFHDLHDDDDTKTTPSLLFVTESEHMPSDNYLRSLKARDFDLSVRRQATSSILQYSCKFDPFLSYLASNYLDRFLSSQEIPQPKPWMLRLLALSCISLAAKMIKMEFILSDFQVDGGLIFDAKTVERMEYMILGALKWRMRSITPFSFLSYFMSLFELDNPPLILSLKARTTEIILKAQNDIRLLEFKPSVIAASALLCASLELFSLQFPFFRKAIFNSSYVHKELLQQCYNVMQEIDMDGYEASGFDTVTSWDTPVNVLDRQFSSYVSSETADDDDDQTTAPAVGREIKRRKIIGYCNNPTVQISQIPHCCADDA